MSPNVSPTASEFFSLTEGIYRCLPFGEFRWQAHGFGTRLTNPPADVTLRQVHSATVICDARDLADRACEGDALIGNEIGRSLAVRTADCVPILLLDPQTRSVAAIHAGWRGTAAAIVQRAVEALAASFGAQAAGIRAAIGPSIRVCCYQVGADVARQFVAGETQCYLDLPAANQRQLEAAGLDPAHIFDSGLCTRCRAHEFFSYRREPSNPGRMLSSICRLA